MSKIKKRFTLEKKRGETPFGLVQKYKINNPDYADLPIAFAGRLDPLATGRMLFLVGEECKKREHYNNLDKEYVFQVLLGFSSDTGDVMGMAEAGPLGNTGKKISEKPWQQLIGKQEFPYPLFSSKTVQGKPLFAWALEGNTEGLVIPTKEVEIYSLQIKGQKKISAKQLQHEIAGQINSIPKITDPKKAWGKDFRRADIRKRWDELFSEISPETEFTVLEFSCTCSSGTYMRTLAGEIGTMLGTKGLAFSIRREKIGIYRKFSINLFSKTIKKSFWMPKY